MASKEDVGLQSGREEEERSSQWSQIPSDLVGIISSKIGEVSDYVRFRAVCPSWRLATKPAPKIPSQLPWLMLPSSDLDPENHRSFFSLADEKVYRLHLPEACCVEESKEKKKTTIICGTKYGWLVMVDNTSLALSLLNPLTRAQIHLPPLADLPLALVPRPDRGGPLMPKYIRHVFLSKDPTTREEEDCVIVVGFYGYSSDIAFCRLGVGESAWTLLDTTLRFGACSVIYRHGRFYATDQRGHSVMIDTACNPVKPITTVIRWLQSLPTHRFILQFHLVDSADKILLVASWFELRRASVSSLCHITNDTFTSKDHDFIWDYKNKNTGNGAFILQGIEKRKDCISIYELSSFVGELQWCEIKDLNNASLFLTKNWSSSVICAHVNDNSLSKEKGRIYFNFHDKTHYSYSREKITLLARPLEENTKSRGCTYLVPLYAKKDIADETNIETVHCIDIVNIGDKSCQQLRFQSDPSESLWITPNLHDVGCQLSSKPSVLAGATTTTHY